MERGGVRHSGPVCVDERRANPSEAEGGRIRTHGNWNPPQAEADAVQARRVLLFRQRCMGLLKIVQKSEHLLVAQVSQGEPRNVTLVTLRHEAQKQPPRVSIRKDGMT